MGIAPGDPARPGIQNKRRLLTVLFSVLWGLLVLRLPLSGICLQSNTPGKAFNQNLT